MTAPPPPTPDLPDLGARALDTLQFLAKVAGAALIVWQLVERVGKPYFAWRKRRQAELIREVLHEELACPDGIQGKLDRLMRRQDEIFGELDLFIEIASDNRERLDETRELLDAAGYASPNRRAHERRQSGERADLAFLELHERRTARRRRAD